MSKSFAVDPEIKEAEAFRWAILNAIEQDHSNVSIEEDSQALHGCNQFKWSTRLLESF